MIAACRTCGRDYVVSCTEAEYLDWKDNNRLIQNAMPHVPKEERELLISGTCGECFERIFRGEDD